MKIKIEDSVKSYKVFLVALLISFCTILPILIQSGWNLYMVGDYMTQQIPFIKESRRMFLSGTPFWSWNTFLGANYLGSYSFYVYGSPFFWPLVILTERFLGTGLAAMFVLKHGVAAWTAFLYLKKHVRSELYAAAGSFMYAFSFFSMDSTFYYHFLDVIALFPLVLYFTDEVLDNGKTYLLFLVSLVNALVNYYFYIGTSIFFLIYLIVRVCSSEKYKFKDGFRCLMFYGLGGLASAVILLPSALTLLETDKATSSHKNMLLAGVYAIPHIFKIIKGLILPSEGILSSAVGFNYAQYCSTTAFLPLFGAFFWITELKDKSKTWSTRLMKICLLITVIPFGNGVFNLFSNMRYTRWWYCLVLILVLVSINVIENLQQSEEDPRPKYKFAVRLITILTFVFYVLLGVAKAIWVYVLRYQNKIEVVRIIGRYLSGNSFDKEYIMRDLRYFLALGVLIVLSYGVLMILIKKKFIFDPKKVAVTTAVVCFLSYSLYLQNEIYTYRADNRDFVSAQAQTEDTSYTSRTMNKMSYANYGMIINEPTISTFNSFKSHATSQFCRIAGYEVGSMPMTKPFFNTQAIQTVLNTSKVIEKDKTEHEAEYYAPFGYTYDYYVIDDGIEFTKNKKENNRRIELMTKACYVSKENEKKISGLLQKFDENETFDWKKESAERKASACTSFEMNSSGFKAVSEGNKERLVYFSIPNDTGWQVKVNGKDTDIVEINGRMIGIIVPPGRADIEADFVPPGLKAGAAVSAVVFIGVSAYCLIDWQRKKKKA